jgi:hypothetical protein
MKKQQLVTYSPEEDKQFSIKISEVIASREKQPRFESDEQIESLAMENINHRNKISKQELEVSEKKEDGQDGQDGECEDSESRAKCKTFGKFIINHNELDNQKFKIRYISGSKVPKLSLRKKQLSVESNGQKIDSEKEEGGQDGQDGECEDSESDQEYNSDSDKKDKKYKEELKNIFNTCPKDLINHKNTSEIEISCFLSEELLNLVTQHKISIPEIFTSTEQNSSSKKNISYINYDKLFKLFVHIVATDVQTKIIPTDNNASAPTPVLRTNLITIINESAELELLKIVLPLRLCKLFGALKESYEAFYGKSKKRTRTGSDKMEKQEITCLPSTDQFGKRKENKMTKKSIKTNTRQVCSI